MIIQYLFFVFVFLFFNIGSTTDISAGSETLLFGSITPCVTIDWI